MIHSPDDSAIRRLFLAFQTHSANHTGTLTPKTMNSLSAIAGHDGDEEDWETEMRGLRRDEEVNHVS
jgi:hypothetical protein